MGLTDPEGTHPFVHSRSNKNKGAEEEIKIVSFLKLILEEKGGKGTMVLKKSVKSLVKRGGVLRPSGYPR